MSRMNRTMKKNSSELESVHIESPCSADWEAMPGDERRRFCGQCKLHVHNVAAMARDAAEALIARREEGERVCVRMEYADDGSCVTADAGCEPTRSSRPATPTRLRAWALTLGAGMLAACQGEGHPRASDAPLPNPLAAPPELPGQHEALAPMDELVAGEGSAFEILQGEIYIGSEEVEREQVSPADSSSPGPPSRTVMGATGPAGPGLRKRGEEALHPPKPEKRSVMMGTPGVPKRLK